MKKQLFTLHDDTVKALNEHKKATGTDKSAFIDALVARELNITLPESATSRHEALGETTDSAAPAPAAESELDAPALSMPVNVTVTPPAPVTAFAPVDTPPSQIEQPMVEPLESVPQNTDNPPAKTGERVCPECGDKFDTPFCLNCL